MADNNNVPNEAEFDATTDVNLTVEQLSYICEYCGKVNKISSANCVRCGKRRPRSEYLKAMDKLEKSKSLGEQQAAAQAQMQAETVSREAIQEEVDRQVEERVADEVAQLQAQDQIKREQDLEDIKRATARDAVLRVVAAENAADNRVAEVEKRTDEILKERSKEIDAYIETEREKALSAAAEKIVAERAGIEDAAKEKIEADRRATEKYATERILTERDEAERIAARQAVLQIIAAEQIADERVRLSKNAIHQAAVERIVEERILADKEAAARYAVEKQAIERAADERIKAERAAVKHLLEQQAMNVAQPYFYPQYMPMMQQSVAQGATQPFTVVPYVNANQPVYQYNPNRVVYKFVPDQASDVYAAPAAAPTSEINEFAMPEDYYQLENVPKKKRRK